MFINRYVLYKFVNKQVFVHIHLNTLNVFIPNNLDLCVKLY